ncbi:acyl-CoA dehydrogenase [Gordonia terrae]|uniref:Dibenzothiophene monooxygenase n=1 Tax=Gordonia terrae TaxID=2055 RepID=A0A2I1R7S6_9ACTN|nr:acyl-CoA dehydrogenase family protein [Gordonia terrae]PKZ65128.1 acyl-CoA dehydrogenase [Gordonia terrae]
MTAPARVVTDRNEILAEIAAGSAERERQGRDPREAVALLRRSRLTALSLDTQSGGAGAGSVELFEFIIDLARADPIAAHILRAHYWFVEQIERFPVGPVRSRWSERIAAGAIVGNASSERGVAAGSRQYATQLVSDGDGWRLRGEKFYSTGTAFADYVTVLAIVPDALRARLVKVVIPVDRDGVSVVDDWDGIGQHRTGTGSTLFDDVRVTSDDVLEFVELDDSTPPAANDGPFLQLFLQALIAGILLAASDDAVALLNSRARTFEHAPSPEPRQDPILLERIGEIDAAAYVARDAVLSAARQVETANALARRGVIDEEQFAQASLAAARVKVHVDRIALPAAAAVFDVGGASSASRSRNLDRHWRNIRTITLHNPTSYKAVAIGDLRVNATPLAGNGYF